MEKYGPETLRDAELLAMLIRAGSKGKDVMTLADELIEKAGSLAGLLNWSPQDLESIHGIGHVKALQIAAVLQIAKRSILQRAEELPILDSPEVVYRFFQPLTAGLEVERFWVLCLNRKNRLIRRVDVTSGTANSSLVHPREVFREAIRHGSSSLIAVHNHPSGDPAPSSADLQVTRRLREASKVVDIDLLDHVIVGRESADPRKLGFYSFSEAGIL